LIEKADLLIAIINRAQRSCKSGGRYLLPIDIAARFCPNSVSPRVADV
jgi:hypothetical protein